MKRITNVIGTFLLLWGIGTNMNAQKASGSATGEGIQYFTEERALTSEEITVGKVIAIKSANNEGKNQWMDFHGTENPAYNMNTTFSYNNVFIVEEGKQGGFVLRRKSDDQYLGTSGMVASKDNAQDLTVVHLEHNNGSDSSDKYSFDNSDTWYPLWGDASESTNSSYVSPYLLRFMKYNSDSENLNANANYFNTGKGSWTVFYAVDVEDFIEQEPQTTDPFELSDAPNNGQFAENTHWYYLKLNGRYLAYNDIEENYSNKTQKFIYSYASNPLSYGSFWAFVKDGDDLKIYNAATGTSMVLSSDGSAERTNYPSMQTEGTDGFTQSWHYTKTTDINDANNFYLFLQGTNYESTANKLNCYGTANEGNPNNYLTFSTGAGAWSYLTVEPVDVNTAINTTKANEAAVNGAVGTLSSDDYTAFTEALNKGSMEGLVEALKIKELTGKTISFDPAQYYYLRSVYQPDKYMVIQQTNGTATTLNSQNASQIWKFIGNETDGYQMTAQGMYLVSGTGVSTTANESEASKYGFVKRSEYARYGFAPKNGSAEIHFAGGNLLCYTGGNGSSWYLVPATSIDVDITAAGYATVNYPFAVQVPEEVTAYTGKADATKGVFTLSKIENGIIPANTPVVLEGTEGTHTLTILADNTTSALESGLEGTLLSKEITETNAYILGNKDSHVGFYQIDAEDRTLGANKAYLVLSPEASSVRSLIFSDGTTTGIESTIAKGAETEEYYDLQGRRVMNPTKGIYVTKNGKKVLINK